ncbi:nuclear transport factor 2 family protein [Mucilaginibacter pallidiroseus]|uniref:Nuclear transport factor 2 family protein n=1 Tax=Mucilaginibacter pallidiroseus TaxID=2599295 RepID=A0A563UJR2_9SPHI|nr:nuclear transport factor 2 family protein [Mucilaginibacter pallidiroseus]TWR31581.1 nuclear transport factor 2 family protein [Mucilaginibacter pallidiroseus]
MIANLRLITCTTAFALALAACDTKKTEPAPSPAESNAKLIKEHFQLLNEHELKPLIAQYDTKAVIVTSDYPGELHGQPGADQVFHQTFYVSPDAKYLVGNTIINDTVAVVEYDVIGLREGHDSPIRYDVRNCSVFKIKDNKIISEATYVNSKLYNAK